MSASPSVKHTLHLGLGEAIRRLIRVEMMYARGITPGTELLEESGLIVEALDKKFQLDLGFDCAEENVPEGIGIFAQSAATACCRLVEDVEPKVKSSSRASVVPPSETPSTDRLSRRFLSRLMGEKE